MMSRLSLEIILKTTNGEAYSKKRIRAIVRSAENEGFEVRVKKRLL